MATELRTATGTVPVAFTYEVSPAETRTHDSPAVPKMIEIVSVWLHGNQQQQIDVDQLSADALTTLRDEAWYCEGQRAQEQKENER